MWRRWRKHRCLHPKLQHLLSSPILYVCLSFPVDSASASCSRMLPAMGTPSHCWWAAQAQPCSHSFLIPLPATPPHWFCTQCLVWSLHFSISAVASHVLSCFPYSSQQQKGLMFPTQTDTNSHTVSPPHGWRLPTACSGFLSYWSQLSWGSWRFLLWDRWKSDLSQFFRQKPFCSCCNFGPELRSAAWLSAAPDDPSLLQSLQKNVKNNNNWPYLVLIWC